MIFLDVLHGHLCPNKVRSKLMSEPGFQLSSSKSQAFKSTSCLIVYSKVDSDISKRLLFASWKVLCLWKAPCSCLSTAGLLGNLQTNNLLFRFSCKLKCLPWVQAQALSVWGQTMYGKSMTCWQVNQLHYVNTFSSSVVTVPSLVLFVQWYF